MKFARLAFPLIFFALTTQADALCRPGTVVACTFLGKPGTKKCIGDGEFDACVPNPPAPGGKRDRFWKIPHSNRRLRASRHHGPANHDGRTEFQSGELRI